MKKVIFATFLLLFISISMPDQTFASSGACSSHGGVSCSAGPDTDNSVICQDGWRDSSVSYWNTASCDTYLCPAQQVLRKSLVDKAQAEGALDLGISKQCEALGLTGYETLNMCLDLRTKEIQQVYNQIDNIVNSYRYTCYETKEVTAPTPKPEAIKPKETVTSTIEKKEEIKSEAQPQNNEVNEAIKIMTTDTFSDVTEGVSYRSSINRLKHENIISGYPDGSFKPSNEINRAEFTKIVVGAAYGSDEIDACTKDVFNDVPKDAWYKNYVCLAKEKGIVDGYSDGSFKPSDSINVVEALKIAYKAFGISTRELATGEVWYGPLIEHARVKNLYLNDWENEAQKVNRGEMAELIWDTKMCVAPLQGTPRCK